MDPGDYPSYERTPGFPSRREEKYTQTYLAPSDKNRSRRAKFSPSRVGDTCKTRFFKFILFFSARATPPSPPPAELCGAIAPYGRARSGEMRARRKNPRGIREKSVKSETRKNRSKRADVIYQAAAYRVSR